MKNLKFILAVLATKITFHILKIVKPGGGTSFPGKVAKVICPNFLTYARKCLKGNIYTITGTNGKTTTASILASILKTEGRKIIHNDCGANMPNGILTAVATQISPKSQDAVLECDEAYLKSVYENLKADYLIVTNFFNDQLDRWGEPEVMKKKVDSAIELNPDLKLILNADDPSLYSLSRGRNAIFYGIESVEFKTRALDIEEVQGNSMCACGLPYNYEKRFYAHLGHWFCECGYARPKPQITARVKLFFDYSYLDVSYNGKTYRLKVNLPGLYNVYNVLSAVSAAILNNIPLRSIDKAVENFKAVFGRSQTLSFDGIRLTTQLIKNPTGANEALKIICAQENSHLLIVINDEYADGRDVSWLWETNFELLQKFEGEIFVSGKRAYDMALRLKYASLDTSKVTVLPKLEKALSSIINYTVEGQKIIILPTYTALVGMQKILKKYKR